MLLAKSADVDSSPETLLQHSMAVFAMARCLAQRLPASVGLDAALLSELEGAALVHDLGKAAEGFQAWLRQERPNWNQRRHEILSAAWAAGVGLTDEAVFAVLTHHKCISGTVPTPGISRLNFSGPVAEEWVPMLEEFEQNRPAINDLWLELLTLSGRTDLPATVDQLLPAMIERDWRVTGRQRKAIAPERRRKASLLRAMLISADHLASGHAEPPPMIDLKSFSPTFELRPFQNSAAVKGNVVLRAPTGSGKTEAALNWASLNQPHNGRLFYSLPYTAALNAMHARLCKEFPAQTDSIGLLHGRAAHHLLGTLEKDYSGEPAAATAEAIGRARLAREMYHAVRVCTPHQLLRYTLRGKGWEQILTELPGACVVFDEVHSYDARLAGFTLGTARLFHTLGASLMFVSATLPKFLARLIHDLVPCSEIAPNPAEKRDAEILNRVRHVVSIEDKTVLDLLPNILDDVNANKKVLIVCNHVRSAQEVARELRKQLPDADICLFHGRFNMRDRREIERRLTPSGLPTVLVATQVVEVSLDIDYGCGYFEAAPIDALVQRMGRVNRKGDDNKPPALIHIATRPLNSHQIYDSSRTQQTTALLQALAGAPLTEGDLTKVVDKVYESGYSAEELTTFNELCNHPYFTAFEESLIAGDYENWTDKVIEVENRIDVLPKQFKEEHDSLIASRRWLEADALTVNVYMSNKVRKYIDVSTDPPVIALPYDSDGLQSPR